MTSFGVFTAQILIEIGEISVLLLQNMKKLLGSF
jgi:hypothetical protein